MAARAIGPTRPDERIELSVLLKPPRQLEELEARLDQGLPPLSREEYAVRYGADPADVARVEAFAQAHGLQVIESSPARRTVRLAGTAGDVAALFGTQLVEYRSDEGTRFRAPTGPIHIPDELEDVVQAVFGLDTRPVARRRALG